MGRTPLFRLLKRAAAIARASRHVAMPLDEFHDVQRAHRVDRRRRRLLQGAGASALDNPAFRALDALSIAQWFDRNGANGWLRKLLHVAYSTGRYGSLPDCRNASAARSTASLTAPTPN